MESVRDFVLQLNKTCKCNYSFHVPAFGSGLAGGSKEFIDDLIQDCWLNYGLDVTMYVL